MSVTGRKLIKAAVSDLKGFFQSTSVPKFKVEYGSRNMREHACFSGQGKKAKLCFSNDFCSFNIQSVDDYNFVLMIISHELAHYLHKHNEHRDTDKLDTRSIEAWADFFCAKILMTLVTFGSKCKEILDELGASAHSGKMLKSLGQALYRLGESIYNIQDDRYSNRVTRIGYCAAGITSFIDSYHMDFNYQRSMDVLTHLYTQGEIRYWLVSEKEAFHLDHKIVDRVNDIHNKIQGYHLQITKGLKPEFSRFIGTAYQVNPKVRELYRKARLELMQQQGCPL